VRNYEHTDRFTLEKMMLAFYQEMKISPPGSEQILETLGYYNSFPQSGKILMIMNDNDPIGYALIQNIWMNRYSKIVILIDEIFIKTEYRKLKPELNLIDFLIANEKLYSISIRFDHLNDKSKRILKTIKFEKDRRELYLKIVDIR
jgi:hypothetical protein